MNYYHYIQTFIFQRNHRILVDEGREQIKFLKEILSYKQIILDTDIHKGNNILRK